MQSDWTQEQMNAAGEKLEAAQSAAEEAAEGTSESDVWTSVWDSLFGNMSEESIMSWIESMQTGAQEGYEKVLEAEQKLSNLLEGIFGAYINAPAQ